MSDSITVALITGAVSLAGSVLSMVVSVVKAKQSSSLMVYRIDQLEEKVNKHNNLVERTYKLDEARALMQQQIDTMWKRVDELRIKVEEMDKED